ncbi:hypothetical protein MTO96_002117 [Rhipicephalus appendiculatus]
MQARSPDRELKRSCCRSGAHVERAGDGQKSVPQDGDSASRAPRSPRRPVPGRLSCYAGRRFGNGSRRRSPQTMPRRPPLTQCSHEAIVRGGRVSISSVGNRPHEAACIRRQAYTGGSGRPDVKSGASPSAGGPLEGDGNRALGGGGMERPGWLLLFERQRAAAAALTVT